VIVHWVVDMDKNIQYYNSRYKALLDDRMNWESIWREAAYYTIPNAFFLFDDYKTSEDGEVSFKRDSYERNISNTAFDAVDVFVSGMQNAASPQSRPWIKLKPEDDELEDNHAFKVWASEAEETLHSTLASKLSESISNMYRNIYTFGVSCALIETDFNNIVKVIDVPVGSFCLSQNDSGTVDAVYREFRLKAVDAIRIFGDKVSDKIKSAYNSGKMDIYFDFVHAVETNERHDKDNPLSKPFESVYFEVGASNFLKKGGYVDFPYVCPRWSREPHHTYGTSIVMRALPSIKMLQSLCKSVIQLKQQLSNPIILVDPAVAEAAKALAYPMGGNVIPMLNRMGDPPVVPLITVQPAAIQVAQDERDRQEARTSQSLYVNLFQMLSMQDNVRTATEVIEMKNESLAMIAPKTQSLHNEGLRKYAELALRALVETGKIYAPEGLELDVLEVEFDSILTQAQKMVGLSQTERAMNGIALAMQTASLTNGKLDPDKIVEVIVEQTGVDPSVMQSQEDVQATRQAQAQAQAQAQQIALAEQMAKATNTLSNSNINNLQQMGMQ
jgi:hypothetical protein